MRRKKNEKRTLNGRRKTDNVSRDRENESKFSRVESLCERRTRCEWSSFCRHIMMTPTIVFAFITQRRQKSSHREIGSHGKCIICYCFLLLSSFKTVSIIGCMKCESNVNFYQTEIKCVALLTIWTMQLSVEIVSYISFFLKFDITYKFPCFDFYLTSFFPSQIYTFAVS